jgi:hypothetical protein
MSRAIVIEVCAAICPWLAFVWCLQRVMRLRKLPFRGFTWLTLTGAIAAGVMLVPVQGLVIARWVAGLNANFSIPLTSMLALIVWEQAFDRETFSEREWTTAWGFGAIGGLALYPMALGLGSFDPYQWGWPFSPLFIFIAALTVWLVWRENRFGILLLLCAAAFQLQLLESTNYWDYLLDPIYSLVSLGWFVGRLVSTRSSRTMRYSDTLPRNISTI